MAKLSPRKTFNPRLYMQRFLLNMMSKTNSVFKMHMIRFDLKRTDIKVSMVRNTDKAIVATTTIPIMDRMGDIDMLMYEIQDFVLCAYYDNERDGFPMKEDDIACLMGCSLFYVSKEIRRIKEKIKETGEKFSMF